MLVVEYHPCPASRASCILKRRAADDRGVVARELVLVEELADLHLDQVEQLGVVVDLIDLVHEDHDRRHVHLTGEQDVLARLGHRAVRGRHHQDRAVHLGGARDHVLDVVGVAGAIHVGVVADSDSYSTWAGRDRDAARLLLGPPCRCRRTPSPWPAPWLAWCDRSPTSAWSCRGRRDRWCPTLQCGLVRWKTSLAIWSGIVLE